MHRVRWPRSYRVLPSRYPPIALFERVADPHEWEALVEVASITNPRVRDEVGEIRLVPAEHRVSGPGASWVMAAFTHVGYPSRFSDGAYGVYYAARTLACAVAETSHHWGRFLSATREPACDMDMRVLVAGIDAQLHDIRGIRDQLAEVYDPDDYTGSQVFAARLRNAGSRGIAYDSVRLDGGECAAGFRPTVVTTLPDKERHLLYHWNGDRIDRYFDDHTEQWMS